MAKEEYHYETVEKEEINFREMLDGYLRYWPLFLTTVLVALLITLVYLRFTPSIYRAVSSVIIENEKSKGPSSDATAFADLGLLKGLSTSSIENELGLLRSKRLMANAVKALNLNIKYIATEGIPRKEIYKQSPFLIRMMRMDESGLKAAMEEEGNQFTIHPLENNTIEIEFDNGDNGIVKKLGDVIELGFADFVVEANEKDDTEPDTETSKEVRIQFLPIESVASSYRSQLQVELVDENSTLIEVSIADQVKQKAKDVLDQIIFEYNQEAIEDKNLIARNTAFFIDERLDIINSELDSVETGKAEFKEANQLTDIQAESTMIIQNASEYKNKQEEVSTQLELTNAMISHLQSSDSNLLPTNLGIDESGTTRLIDEYNSLVLERNRLLKSAQPQNPLVVGLNDQIQQIRNNVMVSLERRRANLQIARDNLQRQAGILGSQISEVPGQERQFRGIERQQNIKEALYLFLLQKREENSLALAVTAPKAKLVDQAYAMNVPVSPNPKIILSVAILVGLFLPFIYINAKNLLNNKVRNREDIKKATRAIPIIGEIPHVALAEDELIRRNDRSVIAEAFSILAANLQYVSDQEDTEQKSICIFVTSSQQGEGKTFTAMNLGITLAGTGKNTVVVGADLRNPQLHRFDGNGHARQKGVSNYLVDNSQNLSDLIRVSGLHPDLKILHSGTVPPNPTELLRKDKMGHLFAELKKAYDYIIVDTAPAMLLADTFLINTYADLTLYMVRAGFTKKKLLEFAIETKEEGRLKNMGFVLNDIKMAESTYGYNYGNAYGVSQENLLSKAEQLWTSLKLFFEKSLRRIKQLAKFF